MGLGGEKPCICHMAPSCVALEAARQLGGTLIHRLENRAFLLGCYNYHPGAILCKYILLPALQCFACSWDLNCLVSKLHLPVMAAEVKARSPHGEDVTLEPLETVRQQVQLVSKSRTLHSIERMRLG